MLRVTTLWRSSCRGGRCRTGVRQRQRGRSGVDGSPRWPCWPWCAPRSQPRAVGLVDSDACRGAGRGADRGTGV